MQRALVPMLLSLACLSCRTKATFGSGTPSVPVGDDRVVADRAQVPCLGVTTSAVRAVLAPTTAESVQRAFSQIQDNLDRLCEDLHQSLAALTLPDQVSGSVAAAVAALAEMKRDRFVVHCRENSLSWATGIELTLRSPGANLQQQVCRYDAPDSGSVAVGSAASGAPVLIGKEVAAEVGAAAPGKPGEVITPGASDPGNDADRGGSPQGGDPPQWCGDQTEECCTQLVAWYRQMAPLFEQYAVRSVTVRWQEIPGGPGECLIRDDSGVDPRGFKLVDSSPAVAISLSPTRWLPLVLVWGPQLAGVDRVTPGSSIFSYFSPAATGNQLEALSDELARLWQQEPALTQATEALRALLPVYMRQKVLYQ